MTEEWKDIPGFEGLYQVSNLGRVKTLARHTGHYTKASDKMMKTCVIGKGYLRVALTKHSVCTSFLVHRLVASAFLGESTLQVNHKNGIKTDNALANLEYVTCKQNLEHAVRSGLMPNGERQGSAKLTAVQVQVIRECKGIIPTIELARYFRLNKATINTIQAGRSWRHLLTPVAV